MQRSTSTCLMVRQSFTIKLQSNRHLFSDSNVTDPYKWQDMLEHSIIHSRHTLSQPQATGRNHQQATVLAHKSSFSGAPVRGPAPHPLENPRTETPIKEDPYLSNSMNTRHAWVPTSAENSMANTRRRVESSLASGTLPEYGVFAAAT